jgi:hypothetical protein
MAGFVGGWVLRGFWFFGVVWGCVGNLVVFCCCWLLGVLLWAGLLCDFLSIPPLYIDSTGA